MLMASAFQTDSILSMKRIFKSTKKHISHMRRTTAKHLSHNLFINNLFILFMLPMKFANAIQKLGW